MGALGHQQEVSAKYTMVDCHSPSNPALGLKIDLSETKPEMAKSNITQEYDSASETDRTPDADKTPDAKSWDQDSALSLLAMSSIVGEDMGMEDGSLLLNQDGSTAKKHAWTTEEDSLLVTLVEKYGASKWSQIAAHLEHRLGKQCRERWHNHLSPELNKRPWTEAEDEMILNCVAKMGTKWAQIVKFVPGRTDNAIKNRWNSHMRKKQRKEQKEADIAAGAVSASKPRAKRKLRTDLDAADTSCADSAAMRNKAKAARTSGNTPSSLDHRAACPVCTSSEETVTITAADFVALQGRGVFSNDVHTFEEFCSTATAEGCTVTKPPSHGLKLDISSKPTSPSANVPTSPLHGGCDVIAATNEQVTST